MLFRQLSAALLVVAVSLLLAGCSPAGDRPPLGTVTGKVTVDGQPLSGVIISFMPDSGRAATATTNDQGEYQLIYLDGVQGCKVGPNTIGFFVPTGGSPSHPIPKKYQEKSDIKVDVKAGKNTFDFDLKSEGTPAKAPPLKAGQVLD